MFVPVNGTEGEWNGARNRSRTGTALRPRDFKSLVSTHSTIRAEGRWRREPESNRPTRICNPVHNRFAIAPLSRKKGSCCFPLNVGAGDESRTRDLNLGKVALYQLSYSRMNNAFALHQA